MIEIGKTYKLKKIKGLNTNSEEEYKILNIFPSENEQLGDIAVYDNHGQRYVAPVSAFVDPENPEEYSPWEITKVESVYEKELQEEMGGCVAATASAVSGGGLGAAPTPALVSSFANGGPCMVNGKPVAGKSVKKKKKKKNEAFFTKEQLSPTKVTPEQMIEMVEETFDPMEVLQTIVKNNREIIKVTVCYDNPKDQVLTHLLNIEYLDIDEETVIDEVTETELSIQDCKDELVYIFSTHEAIDGELYEEIIWNIQEDFNEAYERITNLLAKQLDRMNFEFANTEEIIYKKEGKYKYLLKFDNENGILKFNISKDNNIIWEKTWELEEKEDVNPIFQEIEDIYNQYGI